MMKPLLSLAVGLSTVASLAACSPSQIASAVGNAAASAAGQLSGKIYAPQSQVALVASGAGNLVGNSGGTYSTFAVRSDETGVPNATVRISNAGTSVATVTTDGSGNFKANVSGGSTYQVVATFTAKGGSTVTVNGFGAVDVLNPVQLGVAHNMVASKLLTANVNKPDWAAFRAAVSMMESDLQSVASTPTPSDQASAAAAFDANATSATKAAVAAITNK